MTDHANLQKHFHRALTDAAKSSGVHLRDASIGALVAAAKMLLHATGREVALHYIDDVRKWVYETPHRASVDLRPIEPPAGEG